MHEIGGVGVGVADGVGVGVGVTDGVGLGVTDGVGVGVTEGVGVGVGVGEMVNCTEQRLFPTAARGTDCGVFGAAG